MKKIIIFSIVMGVIGMLFEAKAQNELPIGIQQERAVKVIYTNWRGETATREIIPVSIAWGKTAWHPHEQWLLKVWDVERKAYREYALKDIKQWL